MTKLREMYLLEKKLIVMLPAVLIGLSLALPAKADAETSTPNIIVVFADDQGCFATMIE